MSEMKAAMLWRIRQHCPNREGPSSIREGPAPLPVLRL